MGERAVMAIVVGVMGVIGVLAQGTPTAPGGKAPLTEAGYEKTMKQIDASFRALRINNKAMNHVDGARDARRLAGWFADVRTFWESKQTPEAASLATTAAQAARDIEQASTAMNMETLDRAERTLQDTCTECHAAYRERLPDGAFRIKAR